MAEVTTLDIAKNIAELLNEDGFAASALVAETGRIVLSVEVLDENESVRSFRFLGGEVTR